MRQNQAFLLAIGGIFSLCLFIIGVIWSWQGYRALFQGEARLSWPPVTGKIVRVTAQRGQRQIEALSRHGRTSFGFWVSVTYDYEVAGTPYTASISYFYEENHMIAESEQKTAILQYFPVGKQATLFYNPDDPRKFAIEPPVAGRSQFLLLQGAACVALSLFIGTRMLAARLPRAPSSRY